MRWLSAPRKWLRRTEIFKGINTVYAMVAATSLLLSHELICIHNTRLHSLRGGVYLTLRDTLAFS